MIVADSRADAPLARLCRYAEDAYDAVGGGQVSPDPRLAPDWRVRGTLIGQDAVLRKSVELGDRLVFYGWLLESIPNPGHFVLVIRGTIGAIEWAIDFEIGLTSHPIGGYVEDGFYGLAKTLALEGTGQPLVQAIAWIVGEGTLIVTGHSLGAALATLVAADCADPSRLGSRVSARLIASPRVGERAFVQAFGARVPDHMMYANTADIVPTVPFAFGYSDVPNVTKLDPADEICTSRACQHHALVYEYLMDPSSVDLANVATQDRPYAACIRAPAAKAA